MAESGRVRFRNRLRPIKTVKNRFLAFLFLEARQKSEREEHWSLKAGRKKDTGRKEICLSKFSFLFCFLFNFSSVFYRISPLWPRHCWRWLHGPLHVKSVAKRGNMALVIMPCIVPLVFRNSSPSFRRCTNSSERKDT